MVYMQILKMRRGWIKAAEIARFGSFLDNLATTIQPVVMQPFILPALQLQAAQLGVSVENLTGRDDKRTSLHGDSDGYARSEVFRVEGGLVVIGLQNRAGRVYYRERSGGTVVVQEVTEEETQALEVNAFVSTLEQANAILDSISTVLKSELNIELQNYFFFNNDFDAIRKEAVVEELPCTEVDIRAARALAARASRNLAISIKSSRGLLVRDLDKIVSAERAPELVDGLIAGGVALREVVIVCGASQSQVARVPDKKSLVKLAKDGLRCACGKPIDQESPEDLVTVTDVGALLLDKSRWLSVLVKEELISLGIPSTDILLECLLGSDEVDCVANISGEIAIFELKDKEFSMGNAYSFSAKMSVINPDHSVIISTDKVASDVKDHFSRARRDPRGSRTVHYGDRTDPIIHYIEGEDFATGIRSMVGAIYRADASGAIGRAFRTSVPDVTSVLKAISSKIADDDRASDVADE